MDFFLIWFLPAFLLGGIGLLLFLSTTRHIQRCKEVSTWMKAQAVVASATVESHATWRRFAGSRVRARRVRIEPRIEYTYHVLGSPFRASGYQNFNGTYLGNSEEEAKRIIADYPVGREVTIAYDPNNPADAYLQPQTATHKLVKSRTGQLIMIAIAVVWMAVGGVLNLSSFLGEKASEARIEQSAGVLPFSAQQINQHLDPLVEKYQLACTQEGASGYTLAYTVRACRAAAGNLVTSFEVFSRKESPEKVDLISAIFTPSDEPKTVTFFNEASSLAFEGEVLNSAQAWIAENVAKVAAGEENVTTSLGGINLTLDNLGAALRLNIGKIQ